MQIAFVHHFQIHSTTPKSYYQTPTTLPHTPLTPHIPTYTHVHDSHMLHSLQTLHNAIYTIFHQNQNKT